MWARPHDLKSRDIDLKPFAMTPGDPGKEFSPKLFSKKHRKLKQIAKTRKNRQRKMARLLDFCTCRFELARQKHTDRRAHV